jgi:site-specific recombinase XerD
VFRHRAGVWAARFTCGAGHIHQERVGPIKSDAIRVYHARRSRTHSEPGWCPAIERRAAAARAADQQRRRVTFGQYVPVYMAHAEVTKRSWKSDKGRLAVAVAKFGGRQLDAVTSLDVEQLITELRASGLTPATCNRYRDGLSALFKRALRDGLVSANPVRPVGKFKEAGERLLWLTLEEETAIREALAPGLRPLFTVSLNTGLRWGEQVGLRWRDIDVVSGTITIPRSKHGHVRTVPTNSTVRGVLVDLATRRTRPDEPDELVFAVTYRQAAKFFPQAVERAQATLREAGHDASRLDGYVWHCNRHTFASRLVMAGTDLLVVKELGGWRTLAMVQRYAHLAPAHLAAAVERLVQAGNALPAAMTTPVVTARPEAGAVVELRRNFDGAAVQSSGVS